MKRGKILMTMKGERCESRNVYRDEEEGEGEGGGKRVGVASEN